MASERTMVVESPLFARSGKPWREFKFDKLEKVSRTQQLLVRRLDWLAPGPGGLAEVRAALEQRLRAVFETDVRLTLDLVHVVPPKHLRRYVTEPTVMAVLAPQPHKPRAFLEVELGLAHGTIDLLLGGAGEALALRPLTDIEEGVMSYVLIEALKAAIPAKDPSLPRLRLEGFGRSLEDIMRVLSEETNLAIVQLRVVVGAVAGVVRLIIPATVLAAVNPPEDESALRARFLAEAKTHLKRLGAVRTTLRVEIGQADISSAELYDLSERDVVLVDKLSVRCDKGQAGQAVIRVGNGHLGRIEAAVAVEGGTYKAKINAFSRVDPSRAARSAEVGPGPREGRDVDAKGEAVDLLSDIPLQVAVELGRLQLSAEEIVGLKVGQVLELNKAPGDPVELSINGKQVARGELVEVDGQLGVRVLTLLG